MGVLKIFPHTMRYMISEGGYTDSNGDYWDYETSWSQPVKCDAVPNGSGTTRTFEDGETRAFSFTIYLPKTSPSLCIGDRIKVMLSNGIEKEFTVKGFQRHQLSCKVWV